MSTVETEVLIAAPPEAVWAVLTDFARYAEWNTAMPRGWGQADMGAWVAFLIAAPGLPGVKLPVPCRVRACEAPRTLAWTGGVWPLLMGDHYFELHPHDAGTRLVHGERFSGLLAKPAVVQALLPAYEQMNAALVKRLLG